MRIVCADAPAPPRSSLRRWNGTVYSCIGRCVCEAWETWIPIGTPEERCCFKSGFNTEVPPAPCCPCCASACNRLLWGKKRRRTRFAKRTRQQGQAKGEGSDARARVPGMQKWWFALLLVLGGAMGQYFTPSGGTTFLRQDLSGSITLRGPAVVSHDLLPNLVEGERIDHIRFACGANLTGSDELQFFSIVPSLYRLLNTYDADNALPPSLVMRGDHLLGGRVKLRADSNETAVEITYTVVATLHTTWIPPWLLVAVPGSVLPFLFLFACSGWLMRTGRRQRAAGGRQELTREELEAQAELIAASVLVRYQQLQLDIRTATSRVEVEAREESTRHRLERLPTKLWHAEDVAASTGHQQDECCLCLQEFEDNDELRLLPCQHFFHTQCIDRWFAAKAYHTRTCPLCKRDAAARGPADANDAAAAAARLVTEPAPERAMPAVTEAVAASGTTAAVATSVPAGQRAAPGHAYDVDVRWPPGRPPSATSTRDAPGEAAPAVATEGEVGPVVGSETAAAPGAGGVPEWRLIGHTWRLASVDGSRHRGDFDFRRQRAGWHRPSLGL